MTHWPMTHRPTHRPHGFTLVELAIVLFVVTLLIGGMLTPLSRQIAERQNSETRNTLEGARTALVGYALSHRDGAGKPYLPCPDRPEGSGSGDGEEDRLPDGRCAIATGMLPWRSLGIADGDAWGNRLDYAVAPAFADANRGIGHTPPPGSDLILCQETGCARPLAVAAIMLSHGRNGFGAHNVMGRKNLPASSANELANSDGDRSFILRAPAAADSASGEFDDLVIWLSPAWLFGRLCDPAASCAAP
jgi:prepilin-type N-terminal cleavage/methylation domain-containing protein